MKRPSIRCRNGMVSSPHYLASNAGLRVLMDGGNAVDAAIATNAALNVVYPHMCGVGGDAFFLIYDAKSRKLVGLNASGRAPARADIGFYASRGLKSIPVRGMLPVTVPGAVDGWCAASQKYGSMKLRRLFEPAIRYARQGVPVTARLSKRISESLQALSSCSASAKTFLRNGRPLREGEILVQEDLGRTLTRIAEKGRDVFYNGELARTIVRFSETHGGLLSGEDLADHSSNWVEPISTTYRGYRVFEFPPNTQGLTVLLELNLVEGYDLTSLGCQSVECLHLLVEAKKLAFADRDRYVSDPDFVGVPVESLISKSYAARRRRKISESQATKHFSSGSVTGDTIYLATVDREGNAVSLIQSIYYAFGSGLTVDGTGIVLHNRGAYFSLDPDHANRLEPRKRTMHTLIPAVIFRDNELFAVLGTSGADGQPQTQLQVITNMIDFGMDIQEAIEAPRWLSGRRVLEDPPETLSLENRIDGRVRPELARKGHEIRVVEEFSEIMGTAQGITVDPSTRVLSGWADPRGDGLALGW